MPDVPEVSQWEDGIYQLEIDDEVLAGPGEIDNRQATELGNRTRWLKDQLPGKSDTGHNHDAAYSAVGHDHDADYATPAYVDSKAVPPGTILAWPTAAEPAGFLPCEGAAVPRATYAALFAIIGTDYGIGNGATTFNLPDLRGQFMRGWDHGAGIDPNAGDRTDRGDGTGGDVVGSKQDESDNALTTVHYRTGSPYVNDAITVPEDGSVSEYVRTGEGGGSTMYSLGFQRSGGEVRPINASVLFIIKY